MSDIRKILNTLTEMTSGSVASVSMPLTTQRRQDHVDENDAKSNTPEVLEYGNWENSSLTTSKKLKQTRGKAKKLVKKIYGEDTTTESMDGVAPSTKMFTSEGKTKNPVARAAQRVAKGSGKHKNPAKVLPRKAKHKKMYEEEITEQDLIISPVIRRVKDRDLISRDHSRVDHEVEMARGDLHQSQQNAAKILKMIQNTSEQEGLEGWVQEKIIKASDYLNTVREYLENKGQQGVAEGYSLKKTNVDKYMKPGDPDEYTQDINIKDTDYEIINNKTGQVVGTASWTTNDLFGPGALKITMKNGATRWLDIWEREKGNPQTAFNRFVKDPKTAKKYKEQGVAEGSEQVFKVVAVSKSNALEKPTTLNVKASSLDEVFERLAINDWYPLEINGVEVINGKRLKQGVAEDLDANQRRVGQLGPTEKIGKRGTRGRLVGGN